MTFPEEEAGRESLAADVGPALRVDQEHEHVLLARVQAGAARAALGWRLELWRALQHDVQQLGIEQPGIAGPVNGTGAVFLGVDLQRLVAPRQSLGEHAGGRVRRQPVDGLLVIGK